VEDVCVDLQAVHHAARCREGVAAVRKARSDERDATAKGVVFGRRLLGNAEGISRVAPDGEKASGRADEIDLPVIVAGETQRRLAAHFAPGLVPRGKKEFDGLRSSELPRDHFAVKPAEARERDERQGAGNAPIFQR